MAKALVEARGTRAPLWPLDASLSLAPIGPLQLLPSRRWWPGFWPPCHHHHFTKKYYLSRRLCVPSHFFPILLPSSRGFHKRWLMDWPPNTMLSMLKKNTPISGLERKECRISRKPDRGLNYVPQSTGPTQKRQNLRIITIGPQVC